MTRTDITRAVPAGTMTLAPDLTVHRLGYGTMQLTGPGVWGEPRDRRAAIRVLRRAVELGVDLIDTADAYGPFVAEDLVREALHPYDGVTVATKGGQVRTGPGGWHPVGLPEYLRQCVEMSLRRLDVERIELYQVHRIDPRVPLAEQIGVLRDLRAEGKIGHIGLSEVDVEQLEAARSIVEIVSVQNRLNPYFRESIDVAQECARRGIVFLAYSPVGGGRLAKKLPRFDVLIELAQKHDRSVHQIVLAWVRAQGQTVVPIPAARKVEHAVDSAKTSDLELGEDDLAAIDETEFDRS
jgi:aryl-alcohol dehydrogenase-like predicted oxidoreductase